MTIEEAIKTAIEFELKVTEAYKTAAGSASDPTARKVLSVLAEEEEGHVAYLRSRLSEWQKTGKLTPAELVTAVPSRAKIAEGVSMLKADLDKPRAGDDDKAHFKRALDIERNASGFYRKMVSELAEEGQRLFERFVEIEEGHLAMAQAELDAADGLGYWFDIREFDLEAG
jgi:rubrerythrin